MRRSVFGVEYDIERIISSKMQKCEGCKQETATCRKLYVRKGRNSTICVEI